MTETKQPPLGAPSGNSPKIVWEGGSAPAPEIWIDISPKIIFQGMMLAIASLIFASAIGQLSYAQWPGLPGLGLVARLSDIDAERSFPTAYSALMLLVCAVLQGVIAHQPRLSLGSQTRRWRTLAWIFLFLSLDELLSFHELAIDPVREQFGLSGAFYFAWVIPAMALVGLFGLSFFQFWLRLPPHPRLLFALAATLYVGGALGVEMVNGAYLAEAGETWIYLALQHFEELMEMVGIAIFIHALLSYARIKLNGLRLVVRL